MYLTNLVFFVRTASCKLQIIEIRIWSLEVLFTTCSVIVGMKLTFCTRENLINVRGNTSMPRMDSPLSLAHKILAKSMTSSALMYSPHVNEILPP